MYKTIFCCLIICAISISISLNAAYNGLYIPHAKAYFSNGDTLTAHFLISMDRLAENGDSHLWKRLYQEDTAASGLKAGEDILPYIRFAYVDTSTFFNTANAPLWYCKEIIKLNNFGNFMISESADTLKVTELDSLIYIDTELTAYLEVPSVTRKEAALLQNPILSSFPAESSCVSYTLVNTNPDVSWQELLVYTSQYNDAPSNEYRLSWNLSREEQSTLCERLRLMYYNHDKNILPELILWADKSLKALESIKPSLDNISIFDSDYKQILADSLAIYINNCKALNQRLAKLDRKDYDAVLKQLMGSSNPELYFKTIFPVLPDMSSYYDGGWEKLIQDLFVRGIVVLSYWWD